MVIPRKKRTSLFRQRVEKEWSEYFWKFVLKYSDKIDWFWISSNPNITMEFIEKYHDKEWNWNWISSNPNITMDIIEKYPDKPWNWYVISETPNLTMDIIEKYPDKLSDWKSISKNPKITMDIIDKYLDKPWDWESISCNEFTKEKELFTERCVRKYLAAYRIQQYWNKAIKQ